MLIVKNVDGRPPTKGGLGPSCKELGRFNKYNCFSFDVPRLILESRGKKYVKTDPRPSSPGAIFLAQSKLVFIKVSHVNFEVA